MKIKNLDEIAEVRAGYPTPKNKDFFKDGIYDFIKTSDVGKIKIGSIKSSLTKLNKFGVNKFKPFKKGTILFPKSGMSTILNHRVIMEKEGYIASTLAGIKADENLIHDRYLFYFLMTVDTKKLIPESAYPGMNLSQIKKIKIPLPTLTEQQHIIAKLDVAFAEIDKKNQINLKKLNFIDELKNSILNNQFGDNLIKLKDACELIKRGISPRYLETGGIAVINQKCIRNHKIDYSKARRHDIILKKVPEERLIRKGDVLINSTGHGTLGRVAQVNQEPFEKTTVDSHVTIIRPKKELFNLSFFGNALIKIEKQLEAAGEGTSGQTELSRSKLENEFFIPYIDSIEKQKKVSLVLNSMFENTFIIHNLIAKIMENLKSLKLSFLYIELNSKKYERSRDNSRIN